MKQLLLLVLISMLSLATFAQPRDAKFEADLKRLNRRFENVESIKRLEKDGNTEIRLKRAIESAENELGRFKEKHPDHDISTFNRDLANFKNPVTAASSSDAATLTSSPSVSSYAKVEDLIEFIDEILGFNHDPRKFIRSEDDATDASKRQLRDFRDKLGKTITTEFIALANDDTNRKLTRAKDKVSRDAKSMQSGLSTVDPAKILEETMPDKMLSQYFNVLFNKERVTALSKIYPDIADLKTADKTADGLMAKLGTLEDIEKQGATNYAAFVASIRLYPDRQNSAGLRDQATRAFKSSVWTQGEFANSQILKVHLVSSGWSVERNKVTGTIMSRDQQAHLAVKTTAGKCYAYLILLKQNHQGAGNYGGAYMRSGSNVEMLCENVPK